MIKQHAFKPFIVLLFFLTLTCFHFWLTSRYPDLSGKAMIGDQTALSSLGFAPVLEVNQNDSFWKKVFYDTINWMHTNKKGMTFSFFAGAFFLSIFPLLSRRKLKSGLGNSTLGLFFGMPLGVCVNCAAPIARALHAAGSAVQTSLAALIASPTLNVVVLVMAFGMFPFYLVTLKIVLTLAFILVLVPLGCHFLFRDEVVTQDNQDVCEVNLANNNTITERHENWGAALWWCAITYAKNFLYLLKIALPLMILSGFLGSLLTTSLDWSAIEQLNDNISTLAMFGILLMLSIFGALLPSPMAFDIVISAALLEAGVPIHFVAAFLVTLGSFSIYAFFIVWQSMSLRIALYMMACTILLGLIAGLIAPHFEQANLEKTIKALRDNQKTYAAVNQNEGLRNIQIPSPENAYDPILTRNDPIYGFDQIKSLLADNALKKENLDIGGLPENIGLSKTPFIKGAQTPQIKMDFLSGEEVGLTSPYTISYITGIPDALPQMGMTIASADVHKDGRPDVLISSDAEYRPSLALFANIDGTTFLRQDIDLPEDLPQAVTAALIDLNADYWPDIVFSTYGDKNYVLYNDKGDFRRENLEILSSHSDGTTMSMAFGDVDKDGDIDILLGNWNVGPLFVNFAPSKNILLLQQENGEFSEVDMPGYTGETLTTIMADFDADGIIDIYTGNDFIFNTYSDLLKLGAGDGTFKIAGSRSVTDIVGAQSTMSIDIGDVNNDLKPDFYIGQIAYNGQYMHKMSEIADRNIDYTTYCATPAGQKIAECARETELKYAIARTTHKISDACLGLKDEIDKQKCLHHASVYSMQCDMFKEDTAPSKIDIPPSSRYAEFCAIMTIAYNSDDAMENPYLHLRAKTASLDNVLLINESSQEKRANYIDQANARKVGFGAWTWNARFGDLDNDGWEDLYLVNGHPFTQALGTNLFYRNDGTGNFEDKTKAFGLENHTNTTAFTFADLDHDGDIDIINAPTDAPIHLYKNRLQGQSIQIALQDETTKNTSAIGAIITATFKQGAQEFKTMRMIKGSGGFRSYNQPIAHFGMPSGTRLIHILIEWPNGEKTEIPLNITEPALYTITKTIH